MGEDDGNGLNPWILRRENHIIPSKNVTVKEDAKPADEDEFVEILWMPLEEVMQKSKPAKLRMRRRLLQHSMLGCIKENNQCQMNLY